MKTAIVTVLMAGLMATPALAQNSGGAQGMLNGLLSGNKDQDQAVRNAYERGYQKGREDEARMGSNARSNSGPYSRNEERSNQYGNGPNYPSGGYNQSQNGAFR